MNDKVVGFCIDESGVSTEVFAYSDTSVSAQNNIGETEEWVMDPISLRGAEFTELTLSDDTCMKYFNAIDKVLASEFTDSLYGFVMLSDDTVLAINMDRDTAYQLEFPSLVPTGNNFSIENYEVEE